MIKKLYLIIIIVSIFLHLFLPLTIIPGQVSGSQKCSIVNIALTETIKIVQVGPGDSGVVTFTGVVQVSLVNSKKIFVDLSGESTWDSVIVSPSTLIFASGGSQPFSASIRVRPLESFSNTGTITIRGQWRLNNGSLSGKAQPEQGAVGRIEIAKFFNFNLEGSKSLKRISPGKEVHFEFTIEKRGNFVMGETRLEDFSIEILNEKELVKKGFNITIGQEQPGMPISISVKAPSSISGLGYNYIKIQVTANNDSFENLPPQNLTFLVHNPPENIVHTNEFVNSMWLIIIASFTTFCIYYIYKKKKKKVKNSKI